MSRIAGLIALLIAVAVLGAWTAKLVGATPFADWLYRTNPMTAVCLALSGAALFLPRRPLSRAEALARLALGCVIAAVGTVKLWQLARGQADLPRQTA